MLIHHLTDPHAWVTAQASGAYERSTRDLGLEDVGFIHASLPHQLDGVLDFVYADAPGPLILLTIDTDLLASPWQFDQVVGTRDPFPHIYGPLNLSAVVGVAELHRADSVWSKGADMRAG